LGLGLGSESGAAKRGGVEERHLILRQLRGSLEAPHRTCERRERHVTGASQGAGGQGVSHWASAIGRQLLPAEQPRGAPWPSCGRRRGVRLPRRATLLQRRRHPQGSHGARARRRGVCTRRAPRRETPPVGSCAATPARPPCAPAGPGQGALRQTRWCDGEARGRRTRPPTRAGAAAPHYPRRAHPADGERGRVSRAGVSPPV